MVTPAWLRPFAGFRFPILRVTACVIALLMPTISQAQQTGGTDELAELRHQLQAIAARIDALEKQRNDAANQSQHGGPSANLASPASASMVAAPAISTAQEAAPSTPNPAKAEPFAFAD